MLKGKKFNAFALISYLLAKIINLLYNIEFYYFF